MDTPIAESTAIDQNEAAALFSAMLDPEPPKEEKETEAPEVKEPETEPVEEAQTEDDGVTIEVDGKEVKLTKEELAEAYKSGLRQSDYTKKTMEVAETRKAAESELNKARMERSQYAQALAQQNNLLQAQLQEQNKVDWNALLESDPVEYLKQQHLYQQRQAQLQQTFAEQQRMASIQQAEAQQYQATYLKQQADELLAKLPDWKDETKAKAEKQAIREFLVKEGFDAKALDGISDHKAVILARKAMLYEQMVAKAQAAAKKVENLPQKVIKPSSGEAPQLDKRGAAYQRLSKSGSIDDAAAVFSSFL